MASYYSNNYDPNKSNTYKFLGLNRQRYTNKGEFESMKNMSSSEYPCAAPRGKRTAVCDIPGTVQAVAAPDSYNVDELTGFTGIAGQAFYYNGVKKSGTVLLRYSFKWSIVRRNNMYIMSGFDRDTGNYSLYYYTITTDDFGNNARSMPYLIVTAGKDKQGNYLETFRYNYAALDNHSFTDSLGNSLTSSMFFNRYGTGSRLRQSPNIFENMFKIGEQINISGFPKSDTDNRIFTYHVKDDELNVFADSDYQGNNTADTDITDLSELNDYDIVTATVAGFDMGYVGVTGITCYTHKIYLDLRNKNGASVDFIDMNDSSNTYDSIKYCIGVTLSPVSHKFDNVCVYNNSLFGTVPSGAQLYGSYSGDIFDFSSIGESGEAVFTRLVPDVPGRFTGLAAYNSQLIAFKESDIFIMYGDNYTNYKLTSIRGIGCIDPKSIQVTPQGIIFLSYNGFCLFSGSAVPTHISQCFYHSRYVSAVSGFDGKLYYAAAVRSDGVRELLTYDLRYNLWHVQDDLNVSGMFPFRGSFYIADQSKLYRLEDEADMGVGWEFVSVKTHANTLDSKAITEIWIRATVPDGCYFSVHTCADDGKWVYHDSFGKSERFVYRCPVRINFGCTFRYKITGNGPIVIHEVELVTQGAGRTFELSAQVSPVKYVTEDKKINDTDFDWKW